MLGNPTIFDRQLLRVRRERARRLGPETFLLDRIAADMAGRLSVILRPFQRVADVGTFGDSLRRTLAMSGRDDGKFADILAVGSDAQWFDKSFARIVADEEMLPFAEGSLDLIVSALALQFANDLPGILIQMRRALKADGLLLVALVGGDSLHELREAFAVAESEIEGGVSPRVAPFADLRDGGMLLQRAGFALPVADSDRITVRYDSVFALMHDLRRMGATNVLCERRRTLLRRTTLARMADVYSSRFTDSDGRIRATFEVIWLSGWVPHESQQKPLRPGSAVRRLADALGAREISTGEKPGE